MKENKIKSVSPEQLTQAYSFLYPSEFTNENSFEEIKEILTKWLSRYFTDPERTIATTNYAGKVTKALFYSLNIKMPKTKKEMLSVLKIE